MKASIARKLAVPVSASFMLALAMLLAGAYFSMSRQVRIEAEHYAKVIVGFYADLVSYETNRDDVPLTAESSEYFNFYGEYVCSWYRVDYLYAYVPDFEKGTIKYLSVSMNRKKFGDLADDHMEGMTVEYELSDEEVEAWKDTSVFAIVKSDRFEKATDVSMRIRDRHDNMVMVGAAVSTDELSKEVANGFLAIAVVMLVVCALIAGVLYFFLRRMVTRPARKISKKMSEYFSDGKRSTIRLESGGSEEFSMIADSFNRMTGDIDRYIDDIARLGHERERQQAEVDIASGIQKGMLPSDKASFGECGIMAVMKPAREVGGDLYYYYRIDPSHTLICVADVSGKGISSALIMAVTLTLIRQFAKMGCSPAEILRNVNDNFSEYNPAMMFVTACIGIYDSADGILTYANAGHNPPYLIHGAPQVLDDSHGTPLGLFQGEKYADVSVRMEEGDSVFMYTDGVNEAVNGSGEFYGIDRLEKVLLDTAERGSMDYADAVVASVQDFVGDAEQSDDVTILVLRARKKPVLELGYDVREFAAIKDMILAGMLPQQLKMDLCVAAEECFVNICSYAFDGPAPEGERILFSFEYSDKVEMRFVDGGRPFDPRKGLPDAEEYDIDTQVGGLGRLIAFTVADSVDYEYRDGRNILTITKSLN